MDILRHIPIPLPSGYLRGFDIVAFNNQPGFPNIFLGRYYPQGGSWWYYYLVVPALKAPLPFLIALGASLWLLLRTGRSRDWALVAVFLVPPAAIFLNFSLVAYRQLGLRYILPLWPFLILSLGILLEELGRSRPRSRIRPVAAALAAWFALGSLLTWPDYLTHFNLIAGGNRNGWRWLVVSDCDWGQDLPALAEWQRRNGYPPMHVLYYGTAPLAAYGVRAVPWMTRPVAPYLAISVTHYYILGKHPLVRFLRKYRAPIARLGNSIHIFEIDPAVMAAVAGVSAR